MMVLSDSAPTRIEQVGAALYGARRWKRPLSIGLQVSRNTLIAWHEGTYNSPADLDERLEAVVARELEIADEHRDKVARVSEALRGRLGK
jgi:hypothetical protein